MNRQPRDRGGENRTALLRQSAALHAPMAHSTKHRLKTNPFLHSSSPMVMPEMLTQHVKQSTAQNV